MADNIEVLRAALRYIEHTANGKQELLVEQMRNAIRALSPAGGDWVMVPRTDLLELARDCNKSAITLGEIGLRGQCIEARNKINQMLAASPQQEPGADGCGACGDSCANRGACRLADDSPTRLYALAAAIRGEADIADRPGQMARLNAIADELSVHSKPTPADDPSGQTLAGAGVLAEIEDHAGHVNWCADKLREHGYRVAAGALDETATLLRRIRPLTATSAGTTGDDSEDAARYRWLREGERRGITITVGHFIMPPGKLLDEAIDAARRAREVGNG